MAPAPPASEIVMGFWHVPLASPRQCPLEPGACLAGEGRDVYDHENDVGAAAAVCRQRWCGARGGQRVPFHADLAAILRLTKS